MFCGIKTYNTCCLSALIQVNNHLPLVALAHDTLFEVNAEICCSGVSSRYCYGKCYRNCADGSKPI